MNFHFGRLFLFICLFSLATDAFAAIGVPVSYQLPIDVPLPKTYRVTLAVVDPQKPNWIISQFASGMVRTVTAENGGKFSEIWDGLDDNFMPVPPGTYGVKGIYTPAEKWQVDGEYHAIVPRFVGGPSSFLPTSDQWNKAEPFGGDPCGAPMSDIDVGPNGVGIFYYSYLENGLNNPMIDLKKPGVGIEQFVRAFGSGGAGGGTSTCTDGETVWSFSTDGGPKYVYRADGKSFGTGHAQRSDVYRPDGWVKSMACWRDTAAGKSYVFIAQGGKIEETNNGLNYSESNTERIDRITLHDGETGKVIGDIPCNNPIAIAVQGNTLYLVQGTAEGSVVSTVALQAGLAKPKVEQLFANNSILRPSDIAVDSQGRIYLCYPGANMVYQLDRAGKGLHSYGQFYVQDPGFYYRERFIAPTKIATWTDEAGNDRLLVLEMGGPNRLSEWSIDGKLLREFQSLQTKANDGYAIDPEHPDQVYIGGQGGWLTRFKVDYTTGKWTVDAVWPNVGIDAKAPGFDHPQFINLNGQEYLACGRSSNIYRREHGGRWRLSAAIIREQQGNKWMTYTWHDANGDGMVQEDEYRNRPLEMPGGLLKYHGNQWLDDLSLVAINQGGPDVWRLAPAGFDAHGNPIFDKWEKLFTDPIFQARKAGTANALYGGNELTDSFDSDWAMVHGSMKEGFYVTARGGANFSANEGAQDKVSRYVPDGKGGYTLQWRTGRRALQGLAKEGEIYANIHIWKPINGLLSVVDQSRCGILLYTKDGLYVDSIFPDGRRFNNATAGLYPQPGEFFAGYVYGNAVNKKIYFAMGKVSPLLYEAQGWSLAENPVHTLTAVQQRVTITAAQVASPPEIALTVRGGAGSAKIARFTPALGGAVLDGSMAGWESTEPVNFQADKDQTVEVRCLYDPETLYLRWHARLAGKFEAKALQPIDRIFTHDRLADTLSVYMQGNLNAKPSENKDGRPGDVRIICGLFKDGDVVKPVALGLYPTWAGVGEANPISYRTPVGKVDFAHVGLVTGAKVNSVMDDDGKGFVLTAAIPRSAIPGLPTLTGGLRTMVNFEATFGGHNKFWWANTDGSASRETYDEPTEVRLYPGSWAPAQFLGIDQGVVVQNWQICGPFGGSGAEKFQWDISGLMPGTNLDYKRAGDEYATAASYPPDNGVDLNAVYTGEMIRGYWNDPHQLRWQRATIADLDTRVVLGGAVQTRYGATWINVPATTEVEFQFLSHYQTTLRWFLNDTEVKGLAYGKESPFIAKRKLTPAQAGIW
ncbi:MAG: hypothetical protein WCJ56_03890 [bacterium]